MAEALANVEVLEPGQRSLRELADEANREHALVLEAGGTMVEHAIRAGEALLTAQSQMPRGGAWMEWMRSGAVGFSTTTSALYMRVARYKDLVRQDGATTLREAQALLAEAPHAHKGGPRRLPSWYRQEAERLRREGYSAYACGKELGVSPHTVQRWTEPGFAERDNEATRRRSKEKLRLRRIAKEQERQREIRRAVRKAGAATQEAWAMAERMQDVLAQAHRETEDRAARRALSEAGVHHRKMRDEIVRALGVS